MRRFSRGPASVGRSALWMLLVPLLVAPGCKKFPNLGGLKLEQFLPKVTWNRMRVDRVDFQGLDAVFVFDVENRAPVDLRMARFDYDLKLEGLDFLSGDSEDGFDLPRDETAKLRIPASIGFAQVIDLVGGLQGKDEVSFGLGGKMGFDTPAGPLDVPYRKEGGVPVLKAPQIRPTAIRLAELKPLQNRATLELDLAVTNKAKVDAYSMRDFDYGIHLGGTRVLQGALQELTVEPGATATRTLPFTVNLLELGSSIVTAITQKRPVDVRFDAGLSVQTPLGAIPLNVDETVNLRIQ